MSQNKTPIACLSRFDVTTAVLMSPQSVLQDCFNFFIPVKSTLSKSGSYLCAKPNEPCK